MVTDDGPPKQVIFLTESPGGPRISATVPVKESDRKGRRISIRVTDEVYAQVARLAKHDRRTVAGWVKLAIEDAIATAGSKKR
jgi:hypothetical protein